MPPTAPAAIFSDNSGTVLANPFVSTNTGFWAFYADNRAYDITANGGGIPAPFTWGAVQVVEAQNIPTQFSDNLIPSRYSNLSALCSAAAGAGQQVTLSSVQPVSASFSCAAPVQFLAGGVIEPLSGQAVTLPSMPTASSYQQIFDLSHGGSIIITNPGPLPIGWFGAKADATVTDNKPFIQYAVTTMQASAAGAGEIYCPNGMWGVASPVTLPGQVGMLMDRGCIISALSSFSPSTGAPVIYGGAPGCIVAANSLVHGGSINVNGFADGGYLGNCIQEQSGLRDLEISGWNLYGAEAATGNSQQFIWDDVRSVGLPTASPVSGRKAFWLNGIGGTASLRALTGTANLNLAGSGQPSGVCFDISANAVFLAGIHGEGCADVIYIEASSTATVSAPFGGPGGTCANLIHFNVSASAGSSILTGYDNACTHAVTDDRLGRSFDYSTNGFNYIDGPLNINGGINLYGTSGSMTISQTLQVLGNQSGQPGATCPSGSVLCLFGNGSGQIIYATNTGARAHITSDPALFQFDSINGSDTGINLQAGTQAAAATQGVNTTLSTPANSSVTCPAGQIWADANFVYVCSAANTVKRTALSSF